MVTMVVIVVAIGMFTLMPTDRLPYGQPEQP